MLILFLIIKYIMVKGFYNIPAAGIGTQKRAAKIILATDKGNIEYEKFSITKLLSQWLWYLQLK